MNHRELPSILIVDDTPANLSLLNDMLKDRGYKPRPVPSGELALRAAKADRPDLILLDINMPGMNGFEVCERLKADPALKDVPVIFISANTEVFDKVKAFAVGGVDYVTKPFQFDEVRARLDAHLEIQRQRRALEESCANLQRLERDRDDLVQMIIHDLRSPLAAISALTEYIIIKTQEDQNELSLDDIEQINQISQEMIRMVDAVLDVSKSETGKMELRLRECDPRSLLEAVMAGLKSLCGERELSLDVPQEPLRLVADEELLGRVLQNLLANAVKYTSAQGNIRLGVESGGEGMLRFFVADNGLGIPAEYQQMIFEKFGQVRGAQARHSTGLGLTFCKLAVEAHGGTIGVESEAGQGSTFWFVVPIKGPQLS